MVVPSLSFAPILGLFTTSAHTSPCLDTPYTSPNLCNTTIDMDPFTLIGVAANLARVIIHLTYTYKLQSTHIGILVDRITSLEKPLESM